MVKTDHIKGYKPSLFSFIIALMVLFCAAHCHAVEPNIDDYGEASGFSDFGGSDDSDGMFGESNLGDMGETDNTENSNTSDPNQENIQSTSSDETSTNNPDTQDPFAITAPVQNQKLEYANATVETPTKTVDTSTDGDDDDDDTSTDDGSSSGTDDTVTDGGTPPAPASEGGMSPVVAGTIGALGTLGVGALYKFGKSVKKHGVKQTFKNIGSAIRHSVKTWRGEGQTEQEFLDEKTKNVQTYPQEIVDQERIRRQRGHEEYGPDDVYQDDPEETDKERKSRVRTPEDPETPRSQSSTELGTPRSQSSTELGTPRSYSSTDLARNQSYSSTELGTPRSQSSTELGTPRSQSSTELGTPRSYSSTDLARDQSYSSTELGTPRSYSSTDLARNQQNYREPRAARAKKRRVDGGFNAPLFDTDPSNKSEFYREIEQKTSTRARSNRQKGFDAIKSGQKQQAPIPKLDLKKALTDDSQATSSRFNSPVGTLSPIPSLNRQSPQDGTFFSQGGDSQPPVKNSGVRAGEGAAAKTLQERPDGQPAPANLQKLSGHAPLIRRASAPQLGENIEGLKLPPVRPFSPQPPAPPAKIDPETQTDPERRSFGTQTEQPAERSIGVGRQVFGEPETPRRERRMREERDTKDKKLEAEQKARLDAAVEAAFFKGRLAEIDKRGATPAPELAPAPAADPKTTGAVKKLHTAVKHLRQQQKNMMKTTITDQEQQLKTLTEQSTKQAAELQAAENEKARLTNAFKQAQDAANEAYQQGRSSAAAEERAKTLQTQLDEATIKVATEQAESKDMKKAQARHKNELNRLRNQKNKKI